jgi:hypothetical protein
MSKALPTLEEFRAIKARAVQGKHVPSGLAMGDVERAQLFRDLEYLCDVIEPAVVDASENDPPLGLKSDDEEHHTVD